MSDTLDAHLAACEQALAEAERIQSERPSWTAVALPIVSLRAVLHEARQAAALRAAVQATYRAGLDCEMARGDALMPAFVALEARRHELALVMGWPTAERTTEEDALAAALAADGSST